MKGSGTGVRYGARLDTAWAREPRGTRVGAGTARGPLLLEGLEVRVVDDGFSEGRHLRERHIICSWGWKPVRVWDAGGRGEVVLDGVVGGRSAFLPGLLITDPGVGPYPRLPPHCEASLLAAGSPQSQRKSHVLPSAGHRPHRGN